jgi:hypothetical protein
MHFDLPMFTLVHVDISVLGIIAGLVIVGGLITGARWNTWNALFLVTTILTSVTGFGFPITKLAPAHVVGDLHVMTAVVALYLNVFVLAVFAWLAWAARRGFRTEKACD